MQSQLLVYFEPTSSKLLTRWSCHGFPIGWKGENDERKPLGF
jgi:hypothetical protein